MKITLTESGFHDAFVRAGRKGQFSRQARTALFQYLEELEQDNGEEIELDVVGLCCDYAEHDNALEAAMEYGFEVDADLDEDYYEETAMEWLQDRTTVIPVVNGGIIVQAF